jgi:hypothetical protein
MKMRYWGYIIVAIAIFGMATQTQAQTLTQRNDEAIRNDSVVVDVLFVKIDPNVEQDYLENDEDKMTRTEPMQSPSTGESLKTLSMLAAIHTPVSMQLRAYGEGGDGISDSSIDERSVDYRQKIYAPVSPSRLR